MKIPYTSVRNGNRFFEPRGAMLAAGFKPKPLGPDGEPSRREALRLYEAWVKVRDRKPSEKTAGLTKEQACLARSYPRRSVGAAWQEWIQTAPWEALAFSNRTKIWWPAWEKRIDPVFGTRSPDTITMAEVGEWRATVVDEFGLDAAHKAMKVWRRFWGVMQALRYTQLSDPSLEVTNTAPRPRSARHRQAGAIHLAKTAWRRGYRGLACIIIAVWDTGFQPGDARTARARHLGTDPVTGLYIIDRSLEGREKTKVAVIGTLSRLGDAMIRTYLRDRGVELHVDAFLFHTRTGSPYRDTTLSHDFAAIRAVVDPADKRQLRDMRRSATTEVFRGEGSANLVSQKFGNTIEHSGFLHKTYNPVDLAQVRQADEARVRGRRKERAANTIPNGRQDSSPAVPNDVPKERGIA